MRIRTPHILDRARLTLREHGLREVLFRALTLPLRPTPLGRRLGYGSRFGSEQARAREWYVHHARPVTVLVRPGAGAERTLRSVRRTTTGDVNAVAPDDLERAAAGVPARDIVCLGSAVKLGRGWLEQLQREAYTRAENGIVGVEPASGPSVAGPTLAVSDACTYVRRDLLDEVGVLADLPDTSLRAWRAGRRVVCAPILDLAGEPPSPEDAFGARWTDWFANREVHAGGDRLRVVYVTEDTGVGGGHRDIFEHLNRLRARGHDVTLFTLAGPPEWFPLEAPVRTFADYDELTGALAQLDAIKIATWWRTALPVWEASVRRGIPAYFVQDIETSYYPDDAAMRERVLGTYRPEFAYITISRWNRERLSVLGHESRLVPPGIDLDTFKPLAATQRRNDVILALGRSNPLKNLALTVEAWRGLREPRPELWLFGVEPELADSAGMRYFEAPTDDEINRLLNEATLFAMTSRHEGFCLPALEAMAAGAAVVATDADGNRDFCRDGENCLMAGPDPTSVTTAFARLLDDPSLRDRLGTAGEETAAEFTWESRIDELESALAEIAARGYQLSLRRR